MMDARILTLRLDFAKYVLSYILAVGLRTIGFFFTILFGTEVLPP